MGICYGQIGSVLWGKSIVRENACNDLAHERKLSSKRKVNYIPILGEISKLHRF